MKQSQRGFTLIELMVTLGIIGMLMAILLPAVQAARESARRSVCQNNLRQLALALHNYHDAHQILPPGSIYGLQPELNGWGWGAMVLPFLDQAPLYEKIDFHTWTGAGTNASEVISTPVPVFLCPSDSAPPQVSSLLLFSQTPVVVATGNYCGVSGMLNRLSTIRMEEVRDGLSQTLCLGERLFQPEPPMGGVAYTSSWIGELTAADGDFNPGFLPYLDASASNPINISMLSPASFASRHPGGAYFAFGDGSVRFLSENMNKVTFEALGTAAGGEAVSY